MTYLVNRYFPKKWETVLSYPTLSLFPQSQNDPVCSDSRARDIHKNERETKKR